MKTIQTFGQNRNGRTAKALLPFLAVAGAATLCLEFANAQQGEGRRGGERQGPPQGRPEPSEIAKHIMAEFDQDKNGVLSLDELTAHIEAMHERHGPPPGGPKQGGQSQRGGQGGPPQGPPPSHR